MTTTFPNAHSRVLAGAAAALLVLLPHTVWSQSAFKIEEASIADIQQAIKAGQTTCQQVVQAYLERAKAYNGTCTAPVAGAIGLPSAVTSACRSRCRPWPAPGRPAPPADRWSDRP